MNHHKFTINSPLQLLRAIFDMTHNFRALNFDLTERSSLGEFPQNRKRNFPVHLVIFRSHGYPNDLPQSSLFWKWIYNVSSWTPVIRPITRSSFGVPPDVAASLSLAQSPSLSPRRSPSLRNSVLHGAHAPALRASDTAPRHLQSSAAPRPRAPRGLATSPCTCPSNTSVRCVCVTSSSPVVFCVVIVWWKSVVKQCCAVFVERVMFRLGQVRIKKVLPWGVSQGQWREATLIGRKWSLISVEASGRHLMPMCIYHEMFNLLEDSGVWYLIRLLRVIKFTLVGNTPNYFWKDSWRLTEIM